MSRNTVSRDDLVGFYRKYIACLNARDWPDLGRFVGDAVTHNSRPIGLSGYRAMLEKDFETIPDLQFKPEMLMAEPPYIASRLRFDCTPRAGFLGLDVGGRRVSFAENVFYEIRDARIHEVWSVIDKTAIEAQL